MTTEQQQTIDFTAELVTVDDATLVRLPQDASDLLPSRGQVAVHASIEGHDFDTVVEPDGRRGHWIRVEVMPPPPADVGYVPAGIDFDAARAAVVPIAAAAKALASLKR